MSRKSDTDSNRCTRRFERRTGWRAIFPCLRNSLPADEGALAVHQVGIRAYCRQELDLINSDERIHTWFAKDVMSPCTGAKAWAEWLESLTHIEGPVHLTIDIDGLDGA